MHFVHQTTQKMSQTFSYFCVLAGDGLIIISEANQITSFHVCPSVLTQYLNALLPYGLLLLKNV